MKSSISRIGAVTLACSPALATMHSEALAPIRLLMVKQEIGFLPKAEQDELAAALAPDLKVLPAADREPLLEFIDGGFVPKRLAESLRAQLGAA